MSCSKPKLLFPIVGTPLIDHMYRWLVEAGVGQVVLAVNHLSDKLRMEVAARRLGDKMLVSVEDAPLGTGGPLKLAGPTLSGDGPIVVVNGDIVSDVNLTDLFAVHRESGADATITLFTVKDPRPFGLVTLDSQENVVAFDEKSDKTEGPGWINAGVYILNPSVIEMIPSGRAVSLEREIFPVLVRQMKLKGWKHDGYWYDIGKIPDYVTANLELLERPDSPFVGKDNDENLKIRAEGPSFVGEGCAIADGARLGPRVILSPGVHVKAGARIRETIIFEETVVGENCHVEEAIIGERVVVGNGVTIGKGSVIAGQIRIPDGANVNPGSIVLN